MKKKLVYGVGINDSDYVVQQCEAFEVNGKKKRKVLWYCPYYSAWTNMLMRCCSSSYQKKYPTYKGCSVDTEWLTFSKFKSWMENQQWQGCQLDKDLLIQGNKIYSADTCVFVTPTVNMFLTDRGNDRGKYMLGVTCYKRDQKYHAQCSNPFTKKREHLGCFTSEQEAHQAWRKRKLELAHELASIQTDPRIAKALIQRYS